MTLIATLLSAFVVAAQAITINVASSGGNATSAYQYGLMFEDINNSGDGGVYAELIQNRAFQGDDVFPRSLAYWHPVGGTNLTLTNLSTPLSSALPTSMEVSGGYGGSVGFYNDGFWGFPAVASWEYKGSFWVEGELNGNVTVCLRSNDSRTTWAEASVNVAAHSGQWTEYTYTFQPTQSAPNGNNTLEFTWDANAADGPVNFDLLSLFPPTYNDRPNGNRIDLMEAMNDLRPSFFRAPGGNNIEGLRPPYWWNWTRTIGPLEDRAGFPGTWSYENTDGLGLIEYLLWARELSMEPILAVWAGLWLNGDTVPQADLDIYVQSALDELEFLTGDASTTWGSHRESLGYGPFPINFVEVGNEDSLNNGAPTYSAYRFQAFYDAITKAYPNITIITSYYDVDVTTGAPPGVATAGDFHEYALPSQMASQFGYFDNYTSAHPVLIGEYAVIQYDGHGSITWNAGAPRAYLPFWYGSVAEAIFLLGAERNSDKIIGASYAPTFMNWNRWEWIPDLIQYDAYPGNTVLSTSWHVIRLLSSVRITENLPFSGAEFGPAYYVAGRNAVTGSHIFKAAVYNATSDVPFSIAFEGVRGGASATLTWLSAPFNASNTIGNTVVETHEESLRAGYDGSFVFSLPEYSVAVLEVGAQSAGYGDASSRSGWQTWKSWGRDAQFAGKRNQWGQGYFDEGHY